MTLQGGGSTWLARYAETEVETFTQKPLSDRRDLNNMIQNEKEIGNSRIIWWQSPKQKSIHTKIIKNTAEKDS